MTDLYDHKRVTPAGRALGEQMARLTEVEVQKLAALGEPDERCRTCAFRAGTVPNGCIQTQADALKCVLEGVTFGCHMDLTGETVCWGWFANMWATKDVATVVKAPWEFSPDPKEVTI